MRNAIILLFFLIAIAMGYGFYLRASDDVINGDRIIGISILVAAFILMPMFLYHRWKDRKVQDYMLSEENIMKMKAFNDSKKPEKQ